MANNLMFEVGIKEANGQLKNLEDRLQALVDKYGTMKIKVEVDHIQDFVNALKTIGNGEQLKPLLDRIDALQTSLTKINGSMGNVDLSSLKKQLSSILGIEERIKKTSDDLTAKGVTRLQINNATATDRMLRDTQIRTLEKNFGMTVEQAKHYIQTAETAGNASSKLEGNIERLSQSITELSGKTFSVNIGNEFKTWAEQVQALVAQVKDLVVQMEKLHSVQVQGGGQAIPSIKSQVDEVVRLTAAYESAAEASKKALNDYVNVRTPQRMASFEEFFGAIPNSFSISKSWEQFIGQVRATWLKAKNALIGDLGGAEPFLQQIATGKNKDWAVTQQMANNILDGAQKYDEACNRASEVISKGHVALKQAFDAKLQPEQVKGIVDQIFKAESIYKKLTDPEFSRGFSFAGSGSNILTDLFGKDVMQQLNNVETQIKRIFTTAERNKYDVWDAKTAEQQALAKKKDADASELLKKAENELAAAKQNLSNTMTQAAESTNQENAADKKLAQTIFELGQKYQYTAEQVQKLAILTTNGQLTSSVVQRSLKVGFNQAEDIVKTIEAVQKLKQEEGKPAPQGGLFDPQKFTTLQEAIDKIIGEINRLKEALAGIGKIDGLADFKTSVNGLQVEVNNLVTALSKISGVLHIDKSADEITAWEKKIVELKTQYEQLQAQVQQTTTTIQQQASASQNSSNQDAEATKKANIERSRQAKLLAEVQAMYEKIANLSASGTGLKGQNITSFGDSLKKLIQELGTIPPNRSLQEIAAEFGVVKTAAKSFFTEINKEAKAAENLRNVRLALKLINEQLASGQSNPKLEALRHQLQAINKEMSVLKKAGNFDAVQQLFTGHKGMSDGAINIIRQMVSEMKKLGASTQETASITSHLTAEEQKLAQAIGHSSQQMRGQSQVISDLKTMATQYLGVWGAQGFLKNVIEIGGQLEMQRLSIGAILGDMAKASELFDRIKNLAIKSPFGVVELDQMTKQLSAYGFEYGELFDMTKRLADISAATGTSVDRLALALGHVRSEAALSGYTLRQFSMANIPLAKKLSEELTRVEGKLVSVADVRKRVRKKEISYEDVLKVLKDLTDEGGMFYNAQEIMAESVKAKYKNLKDSMDIMYNEIAESKVGSGLKNVAALLTTLTRHWQELGAVIIAGAGYWAINRVAMMASNKIMIQANLTMGRFSAAQLEMAAQTGNLTRAQLLQAVATKKLAVADAEASGAVFLLSRAQLQHVANTGKTTAALNMATLATSKYTISQLRMLATMRSMNLGWLANGWLLLTNGIKAAGVAALGFMKAMWPMFAISAVVEVFMSMKREAEQFADAANYVGQSARNMMKDIDDAMKTINKDGKPLDEEGLRNAVNSMKEILEQSEFYTAEQQKQVDKATTLSGKYDVLLKQMKEMREEAEWHANNEGLIETILKNTGRKVVTNDSESYNPQTGKYEKKERLGSNFFNNSLQENIEQVNKSNSKLQSAIQLLSEYQGVMDEAIKKNNNFGLSLEGKSWQEQIKMIAQSGHWDEFVASVENAGSRFNSTAANVKKASDKVVEDWQSIVGDDVKAIRLTLMQEWGMTEDDLNQFAKNNEKTMRWLVDSIAKSLSKLGVAEAVIDDFKQKLLELFGVASSGKATKREPTEYEKQTDLGKRMMRNVLNYNKSNGKGGNGVTTVKEINEITGTGENVKTESEVVKTLKERAQKDHESMKDVGRIYGKTSEEYAKAKKKYEHSLNLAESNGINESEILTGKYKDKTPKNGPDEAAKAVRERVRLIKEAADAYQYWRDKVGEKGAWQHVQEEFGDVLAKIGITAQNIEDVRQHLNNIPNTKEYKAIRDKKVKTEVDKEIAKENDQYRRKDFERDTEKFLSKTQIELDNLTRSWETFNSVREATGNVQLAIELSGAQYAEGQTRNLADAIKQKIQKDFDAAGAAEIPFDINLSDEQIGDKIKAAMPKASEDQIKGLVEEYKKWRDLQRDVLKSDIDMFAKLVGGAKDYESQLQIIDDKLRKQKEATDNLVKEGKISRSQANRADAIAQSERDEEAWKISLEYANLMNNSLSLTRQEVENGINRAYDIMNQKLEAGRMTAKEYADEIAKIRNIQSEWNKNSFFGINNAWAAGMMGGLSGRRSYYQNDLNKAMTSIAFYEGKIRKGTASDDDIINLNRLRKKAEKDNDKIEGIDSLENLINSFDALSKSLEPVIDLFDKLGMEDVGQVLGMGQKALQSASSMGMGASMLFGQAAGPYGAAIGAGLSLMSSIVGMHDEALQKEIEASKQRQKEMENMSKNLETALDRALGGIFNVGNTAQGQYAMESFTKQFKQYQDIYNERLRLEKELEEVKKQKPASSLLTGSANKSELDAWERKVLTLQSQLRNASYVKDDTYEYLKKAEETQKYYDMQRASLVIQRDELEKQIAAERDKKDSDSGAISDMEQQVKEIEDQLFNFAKDMAKALYDIDVKSWAQQLGDALYDAWKQGEDGAEAFRKKAKEIIGSIAKNIIVQRVIEKSLEPVEKAIVDMMDKSSGELDEKEFTEKIGSMITDSIGTIVPTVEAALDAVDAGLQKQGLSSLKDNSSSVSGSIKSITENTADLLASYLNAIRADVSVNRIELVNIRENYLKDIKAQMISASASLQNIENHTAAIMRSNDVIADKITHLDDNFNALRNRVWSLPVS